MRFLVRQAVWSRKSCEDACEVRCEGRSEVCYDAFWFGFRVQGLGFRVQGLGFRVCVVTSPNPKPLTLNPKRHHSPDPHGPCPASAPAFARPNQGLQP